MAKEVAVITILRGERGKLEELDQLQPDTWIHIVAPNTEDRVRAETEFGIPHDFLVAALDVDEKARTDHEDGTRLILLRVPLRSAETDDVPFNTVPLGMIVMNSFIVTVCQQENEVISDFLTSQVPNWAVARRNRFLLQLLLRTATKYLRYLRQIDREIDTLETRLQTSMRNRELLELLRFEKSLVYFNTALKSNELMMERLQRSREFDKYPEDQDLLEDVLTENQQAIEMVGISSNILSGMMDAFASIISNNLNTVMKFLTSATIVLTLPTLIASFYGMNVGLPLQRNPYAFLILLCISLILSTTVVLIFLRKDWF